MKKFLLLLTLFTSTFSYTLSAQDFVIENFDVEITLNENGDLNITENIDVFFNQKRRGIFRTMPYKYKIDGKRHTTKIKNISVENNKFKVTRNNGTVEIRIGDKDIFIDGKQEYTINYTVESAFLRYENWEELYWNVTGNFWPTRIEKTSVKVSLPKARAFAADELKAYTGTKGSRDNVSSLVQSNETTVTGQVNSTLQSGEGMTIALKFPVGYIPNATSKIVIPWFKRPGLDGPLGAIIPTGLIYLLFSFWKRKRKPNYPTEEVSLQYDAPVGITSAHAGGLIDRKVDTRDLISLIPFWGTEGFLYMHDVEGDIKLEKIKDLPADFPDHEHEFFAALFKSDNMVSLESFKEKFYNTLHKLKRKLGKEIREHDYYDEAYASIFKKWYWSLLSLLLVLGGTAIMIFFLKIVLGIGLIVAGLVALVFNAMHTPLNENGYLLRQKLLGLKAFLSDPPADKVQQLLNDNPNYFERMLPFAVAFDLDEKWMESCSPYIEQAPLWYIHPYYGYGHSTPFSNFSESFQPTEISSAFSSYPASSGSGGGSFSGGGSSGGGFGGGGGGSW